MTEPALPALDENLARELGVADGSLDQLQRDVRGNLEREAGKRTNLILRVRVMKALQAKFPIELPQALIDAELATLKTRDCTGPGSTPPMPEDDARYRARAVQRVTLGLLLAEAMRARGIKVDAQAVRARVEDMAAEYESPQEFIQWYYQQPDRLGEVESMVAEEQAVAELLTTAKVIEQSVAFQDLLKMNETF